MPMCIKDSVREKLMEFVGKKVTVELEDMYNTCHVDDTDHCRHKATYKGTLCEVSNDGIRVSDFMGFRKIVRSFGIERYERVEGYIPFCQMTKTEHSESVTKITRIICENKVIFDTSEKLN